MRLPTFACLMVLLCVALFLGGCNSFPSKNQDPQRDNQASFRKDLAECKEDHPESNAGLHYNRWADCMRLKGWR